MRRWPTAGAPTPAVEMGRGRRGSRLGRVVEERETRRPLSTGASRQLLQNARVNGRSMANNSKRPMTIMAMRTHLANGCRNA